MWDKETQALLLGAMYWTYLLLQPPGNHMVRNVKRKTVIVASMTLMSTMSLLIHVAALLSPWAVFTVRLVHGGCVAMMVCSMGGMWLRWAPPRERSGLIGIHVAGENIGNVLVFPMSALLCKYGFLGGWPSVYYVHGLLGLIWVCLFYFLADEDPATHKYISEAERRYIQGAIPPITKDETANPPYWSMLTSPAMISMAFLHFSFNWGLFLLLSTLPQYMNEVLKFDINANGVFSMLPYMSLMTVLLVSGPLCDLIIRRGVMSVTAIRKVYVIIGNVIPAILLTIMSYMDCSQPILVVTLLTVAVGLSGFSLCSILSNAFDIAGPHAIPAYVIDNTIATIPGIITPYVVAAFTVEQTRGEWQIVFFITAGVMVLGALIFCAFGSGNLQPWATSSRSPYVIDINRPEGVDLNENQRLRPLILDVDHGRDVSKTSI